MTCRTSFKTSPPPFQAVICESLVGICENLPSLVVIISRILHIQQTTVSILYIMPTENHNVLPARVRQQDGRSQSKQRPICKWKHGRWQLMFSLLLSPVRFHFTPNAIRNIVVVVYKDVIDILWQCSGCWKLRHITRP